MDGRLWALTGALVAMAVLAVVLAVLLRAERRRSRRELAEAVAECRALEARIDELSRRSQHHPVVDESADWVITWGDEDSKDDVPVLAVADQVVLSAAFGEPLVKVLALGHGLRRALSPESRNRIGFEMRREVRRTRKVRRREMRQAWKQMRTQEGNVASPSVVAQPVRPPKGRPNGREDVA